MTIGKSFCVTVLLTSLVTSVATADTISSLPTIVFDKAVYFLSTGGDPVVISPGTYTVEAADAWLKLIPLEGPRTEAILIDATSGTHDEEGTISQVLLTPGDHQPELLQLLLILPDGTGLAAVGSTTGVWPRGGRQSFSPQFSFTGETQKARTFTFVPHIPRAPGGTRAGRLPVKCKQEKIDEVLGLIEPEKKKVIIDCHLNLDKKDVIAKSLIFSGSEASYVTFNCNGATLTGEGTDRDNPHTIVVESTGGSRPENVTIKNCNVFGSVRVRGSKSYGALKTPSQQPDFVTFARNTAPKHIVFDNLTIIGRDWVPLYFEAGVSESQLINSEILGKSNSVAIYLDHESYKNTIKDNYIHASTTREVMAIDGSSHNKIMNNTFSALNHGGIYLFRNCGERGVIRHSPPEYNEIVNNIFYYKKYKYFAPSVYFGSRNGGQSFCHKDDGYPYGSSASNLDYARYNVVMQNQFYKRKILYFEESYSEVQIPELREVKISDLVKTKNGKVNSPNYIEHNTLVTPQTVEKNRPAGCYLQNAAKTFLSHGQSLDTLRRSGRSLCSSKLTCTDGTVNRSTISDCRVKTVEFNCQVERNNTGCQKVVSCPSGKTIAGATAACNLEFGTVSVSKVTQVPLNVIRVVKPSDHVSDGSCHVGPNQVQEGEKEIVRVKGVSRVAVGCKEHDKNGGDCHIKGNLYCR